MEGILMFPCLLSTVTSSMIDIGVSKVVCPEGQVLIASGCQSINGMLFPPAAIGMIVFTISAFLAAGCGLMSGIQMGWIFAPVGLSILWSVIGVSFISVVSQRSKPKESRIYR